MNLKEELSKLSRYSPLDKLIEATKGPTKYCPEEFTHMLPSWSMGRDGVTLDGLCLVSPNYLCDVRLRGQNTSYDFIAKKSIQNYRLELSEFVPRNDGPQKAFQIAQVYLYRTDSPEGFRTNLTYVGDDREHWLDSVFDAIPLASMATA